MDFRSRLMAFLYLSKEWASKMSFLKVASWVFLHLLILQLLTLSTAHEFLQVSAVIIIYFSFTLISVVRRTFNSLCLVRHLLLCETWFELKNVDDSDNIKVVAWGEKLFFILLIEQIVLPKLWFISPTAFTRMSLSINSTAIDFAKCFGIRPRTNDEAT